MPLVSGLPLPPTYRWSSFAPQQALELVTTYNLDEKDALASAPGEDIAWADVGTLVGLSGGGILKFPLVLPQGLDLTPFEAGKRVYKTFDAAVKAVHAGPYDLNFGFPMIWDKAGNGYKLMSVQEGNLVDFLGIAGLGGFYVEAGRMKKAQMVADLFFTSMSTTAAWGVAPSKFTYPQPSNPNGIALFTDGNGAEGTAGARHYANPTQANSGRFVNLFTGYGSFAANYHRSLVQMTVTPHALYKDVTSGARVTDTIGPTWMRTKFWEMAVQDLVMRTETVSGNGVAAAVTNPYSALKTMGISEENFLGVAFGPRRFWIAPHLDNHPFALANPNTHGTGQPAEFWINISAGKDPKSGKPRPSWAKGASSSKEFVPTFRFYGPGDPKAESDKLMRFEGDLDAAFEPGVPSEIQAFFEV
jgi:hypothetical protein